EFLEYVDYVGNRYGTLYSEIDRLRAEGKAPLLELETEGAKRVQRRGGRAITNFLAAPPGALERPPPARATPSAPASDARRAQRPPPTPAGRGRRLRRERRERRSRAGRRRAGGDRRAGTERRRYHGAAMIHPRIDELMNQVDSRYALVIVAAKRARQINNY